MKKFRAIISNGREEIGILFHSRFRKGSRLNRGDLKSEMMVCNLDSEKWKVREIIQMD